MKYISCVIFLFSAQLIFSQSVCSYYSTLTIMVNTELELKQDSSFTYRYHTCTGDYVSAGTWTKNKDTVILNSYAEEKIKATASVYEKGDVVEPFVNSKMITARKRAILYLEKDDITRLYRADSRKAKKWERDRPKRKF